MKLTQPGNVENHGNGGSSLNIIYQFRNKLNNGNSGFEGQMNEFIVTLLAWVLDQPQDAADKILTDALNMIRSFFNAHCCAVLEISKDTSDIRIILNGCEDQTILKVSREINIRPLYPSLCSHSAYQSKPAFFISAVKVPPNDEKTRIVWNAWKNSIFCVVPLRSTGTDGGKQQGIGLWGDAEDWYWLQEHAAQMRVLGDIFTRLLKRYQKITVTDEPSPAGIRGRGVRLKSDISPDMFQTAALHGNRARKAGRVGSNVLDLGNGFGSIVIASRALRQVIRRIEQVSKMDTTVLFTGETGTGKGIFARLLYESSDRKNRSFIQVNCAGLPAGLIESELFGREKGAFTGATEKQIGRFELASGGILFLDEIGELPLELQPKLLRTIESGEFERLGNPRTIKVDTRIIASTNRNLDDQIRKGVFRSDLFYRLNVFPIEIPPLRERKEDVPFLVRFYLHKLNKQCNKNITHIPAETMDMLQKYDWPGNVRELVNVIERAVIISDSSSLHLAEKLKAPEAVDYQKVSERRINTALTPLVVVEREHILATLRTTRWKIEGKNGAASILRLKPSTLRARMKKLNIMRP